MKDENFKPYVIDLEASGFGRGSYPIEVGFVTSEQRLGCCLIKPLNSWVHWSEEAENLHGIQRSLLNEKGKTITSVAHWLNDNLKGITVYSDAWANDMCWLGKLFDEAGVVQTFKIESILDLLNEEEKEKWTPLYHQVLSETNAVRHRASRDALNIQQTYLRLKLN
jgi:hypothetical protein